VNDWRHPISAETRVGADIFDRMGIINSPKGKEPDPWPFRPWARKPKQHRLTGDGGGLPIKKLTGILTLLRKGKIK
jgi:hypothetical protein